MDIEANRQFVSVRLSLWSTLKSEENPDGCPITWGHPGPRVETHIFQLVNKKSVLGDVLWRVLQLGHAGSDATIPGVA